MAESKLISPYIIYLNYVPCIDQFKGISLDYPPYPLKISNFNSVLQWLGERENHESFTVSLREKLFVTLHTSAFLSPDSYTGGGASNRFCSLNIVRYIISREEKNFGNVVV